MPSSNLPIVQYKKQILYAIENNDIILITAQTGSGKTTQIPQFLIQAGYTINSILNKTKQMIGIALPRKLAAISITKRISQQMSLNNGQIAFHVRFNSTVNQNTKICLMTDGQLVQKLYQDPLLQQFNVLILDDIHQRSINYQILFGFLKKIMQKRRDLKIIITSATLEEQRIKSFFMLNKQSLKKNIQKENKNNYIKQLKVKSLNLTGRLYSVKINYLRDPTSNYFLKIFQTIIFIDKQQKISSNSGTILVFLASVQEIEGMYTMLDSYQFENKRKFTVLPLHSGLSVQQQNKIFQESFDRKIILSTNIAESSITIPDIYYVIDCGYVKCKVYDQQNGIQKMIVIPCGKYSCEQRTGRAGRVKNGECYRIFTEKAYEKMPQKLPPEIMRIDLSNFILKLKGLGIQDIQNFEYIEKPPQFNTIKAIDKLFAYELVDQNFNLTQKGTRVAQLSLNFKNARLLMNSFDQKFGCSKQILMLVSMLQIQRQLFSSSGLAVIKTKKKNGAKQGDFLTLINIFLRYFNCKNYQKRRICSQMKVRQKTMDHAVKIYHELENQIKNFNRFKTQAEKMQYQYGQDIQEQDQQKLKFHSKFFSQKKNRKKIYQIKSSADVYETILRCIFSGYFTQIAQLQSDGTYLNIHSNNSFGQPIKLQIHPSSILSVTYPQWIIYYEIIKTNHGYYIYNGSQIDVQWIFQLAGHYYKDKRRQNALSNYEKDQQIQRIDYMAIQHQVKNKVNSQQNKLALVSVGEQKKKVQYFKTSVLGLKDKKINKKIKLSFDDQDL